MNTMKEGKVTAHSLTFVEQNSVQNNWINTLSNNKLLTYSSIIKKEPCPMQHLHVSLYSEPLVCINTARPHEDPQSGSVVIHTLQMRGLDYSVVK